MVRISLFLIFIFCSCNRNIDSSISESPYKEYSGNIFSQKIEVNLPNLQETDTSNWIYGIKVFQVLDGNETCYAYGLFSETKDISFYPEFKKKYRFEATAIAKGTGLGIFHEKDSISGLDRYSPPLQSLLDNQFHYDCKDQAEDWSFYPAGNLVTVVTDSTTISKENTTTPEIIRYFGQTDTLELNYAKDPVLIALTNASFGLEFYLENIEEGDGLSITINEIADSKLSRTFVYIDKVISRSLHFFQVSDEGVVNHEYLKKIITPDQPAYRFQVKVRASYRTKAGGEAIELPEQNVTVGRNGTSEVILKLR